MTNQIGRDGFGTADLRMTQAAAVVRQWEGRTLETWEAIEKLRQIVEPIVVRPGGQHVPDLQTTNEPPARTPAAKAHREFKERTDGTSTPF